MILYDFVTATLFLTSIAIIAILNLSCCHVIILLFVLMPHYETCYLLHSSDMLQVDNSWLICVYVINME